MSKTTRLFVLLLLIFVLLLYIPINRNISGGVALRTRLDDWIGLWPVWVVPYLLAIFWWAGCFLWAVFKMKAPMLRSFVISAVVVMLSSYVVYIIYPTYVLRPEIVGSTWASDILQLLYANDHVNNAFPSGHTYTTVLILLYWWNWKPGLRIWWVAISAIIILSTLFTGQHHTPDPLGGILWAVCGYMFGNWWVYKRGEGRDE